MSKERLFFPISFHAHQPIGNFDWVIEDTYTKSYKPLLNAITRHENLKVDFHYSGPLLEWLQNNHLEYLEQVAKLAKSGRLSILGGGFYEPILSIIPEVDRHKQLTLMMDWWQDNYGLKTSGAWLAERVWEPSLAGTLNDAGIDFIMIDDNHIRNAGYTEQDTFFTFITEDQGKDIIVVPINEQIRYLTPWKPIEKTKEFLQQKYDASTKQIMVSFDDAEKMGAWTVDDRSSYNICYEIGYSGHPWIDEYFKLAYSTPWLENGHITEYVHHVPSKGLIYLPTGSYDKMDTWALSTPLRREFETFQRRLKKKEFSDDDSRILKTFFKGSFWRNFLIKYPEVNQMHKRMLFSHKKLFSAMDTIENVSLQKAWNELLKAQSNDPYWHGMFAGVYYKFMRNSIYKHILNADRIVEEITHSNNRNVHIIQEQILMRGNPQIVVQTPFYRAFMEVQEGGTIYELDHISTDYNWLNTFARRMESYHPLDADFIFDQWSKHFLRVFLCSELPSTMDIVKNALNICGTFHNSMYKASIEGDKVILKRTEDLEYPSSVCSIQKLLNFLSDSIKWNIEVEFSHELRTFEQLYLAIELSVCLTSMPSNTQMFINDQEFSLDEINDFTDLLSSNLKIDLFENNEKSCLSLMFSSNLLKSVVYPIYTMAKTDKGWEKQYQGSSIMIIVELVPHERIFHCTGELMLKKLS